MKSYLSFVPISAKQHRRQNRMTVTCIEIAVFLVTAVFSMADMAVRQETARLVAKHGSEETAGFFASEAFRSLFPIAGILFLFVLAAGVFMIAGTLNSNVAGRTRQFGLMRCIGMSRRQIIRCVRLEALNWCRIAVPVGAGAGTIVTWILCAVLKFAVGGEWADIPQLKISWIGVVSGIIVGVLTVWIAAGEPARKAARVAPVAAVSGETRRPKKVRAIPFSGRLPVEKALGIAHAMQKKKNLVLMTGSFALSILLFLSFSVFIDLVNCLMPQSAGAADIEIYAGENGLIESNLLETLKESEGVERAYGRRAVFDVDAEGGVPDFPPAADLISFEDFDLEALKKDGMLEKNSRLEDVKANGGALIITDTDIAVNAVVAVSGIPLKIAGRLKYNPFSADGSADGKTTLIVSDETFRKITGIADYTMLLIKLDGHASEENVSAIRAAAGDRYEWNDCRENDTHGTYLAFLFCVYGFLAIIAMVTVLNIMNSIAMSVSDRMKQYGIMRSVGMSKKAVASMIAAEALTFALIGCAAGIAAGLPFGKWLYDTLVTSHFAYARWQFPTGQLLIIAAFFLVSVLAGIRAPIRRLNEMSITQTISQL